MLNCKLNQFYFSSTSSSAYFRKFEFSNFFKFDKNIIVFSVRVQPEKNIKSANLIALFWFACCFSRLPWHKQVNRNLKLHGMISKKYFFPTIF